MTNPQQHPTYLHVLDDDVIAATTDRRPSQQRDQRQATQILQQISSATGASVYGHMSELIRRILDERPANLMDHFEEFSRRVREEHFTQADDRLEPTYIEPERLTAARRIILMLTLPPTDDFPRAKTPSVELVVGEEETEEHQEPIVRDLMQLQFYWSLAGYGFPSDQMYLLSCCMRKLERNPIVQSCRFWGQIYGLQQGYFVMEVDLTEEEIERRVLVENKEIEEKKHLDEIALPRIETAVIDLIPKRPNTQKTRPPTAKLPLSLYQRAKDIPAELSGTGVNRKTYFVCNRLGDEWTELPTVTPQQLVISRAITKFFTGDLHAKIWSYPTFAGEERHYLRATIARITASTYVSPVGYYRVDGSGEEEEEEPDEEEGVKDNDKVTVCDMAYDPIGATDLLRLESWVHHRSNILAQGRVNWFNPKDLEDNDNEGEAEEDENEDDDAEKKFEEQPEVGPALFGLCSDDVHGKCIRPWTTKLAHDYNRCNDMVIVRSNLWPGAMSYAMQRVHDNLYIGWGTKYVTRNYSPQAIPRCEQEYPDGPEIMEVSDPTVADEEAWRLAHEKRVLLVEEGEGEGEEEGEAEEDEAI